MITAGTRIGPYEIVSPLGAGGMGEVYRAHDTRLGRDVAIKVLPSAFTSNPDRLSRFEQEARTASMLSHPNILVIHDVGSENDVPFVVYELLEGETLRERLKGGPLSLRRAVEYSIQIANGLAAAHEKGIVHRDLKPENIFITRDGRAKILDFGLAKLTQPLANAEAKSNVQTVTGTEPGIILGTVGYMSPEQARGEAADHRADLFAFGVILYEMLSGKRAFQRATAPETLTAILVDDPPPVEGVPPGLERVINHCLEKNPEQRFQSARDLAFDLELISGVSGTTAAAKAPVTLKKTPRISLLLTALLLIASAAIFFVAGKRVGVSRAANPQPVFQNVSFGKGTIYSARFAPDGQTILYGAAWNGKPMEIFSGRIEKPGYRSLGLPSTDILSISPTGEMLIAIDKHYTVGYESTATLARVSLAGGAPRSIMKDVQDASWSPDGKQIAVVRSVNGRYQLEYPIGTVLYRAIGWLGSPRISPKQDMVAFLDHTLRGDDQGFVAIVDLQGKAKTLTNRWGSVAGLVWTNDGKELWFAATATNGRLLHAVDLSGKERVVLAVPGDLTLHDISKDGTVLFSFEKRTRSISFVGPDNQERDLSWLDYSDIRTISRDGKTILFDEEGAGGGSSYVMYLRKTDGSEPIELGEGAPLDLSEDGQWVLGQDITSSPRKIFLLPTGAGQPRNIDIAPIDPQDGSLLHNGKQMIVTGTEPNHTVRIYLMDLDGKNRRTIGPEGARAFGNVISPDDRWVAGLGPDGRLTLYSTDGKSSKAYDGMNQYQCFGWADENTIYAGPFEGVPLRMYRADLKTGQKELFKEIMPPDPAGVSTVSPFAFSPTANAYAYSYRRILSDLYLVKGLK